MSRRCKPWYELSEDERDKYEYRQMVTLLLCVVFVLIFYLYNMFGWHLQFYKFETWEYQNEEQALDYTYSIYYDLQNQFLFRVTEGREPLFELNFDDDDEPWRWMHTVHVSDYCERYWYEYASELESVLAGYDYELVLNQETECFESLQVYIPGDDDSARIAATALKTTLSEIAIPASHFTKYSAAYEAPEALLIYTECDHWEEHVALVSVY